MTTRFAVYYIGWQISHVHQKERRVLGRKRLAQLVDLVCTGPVSISLFDGASECVFHQGQGGMPYQAKDAQVE